MDANPNYKRTSTPNIQNVTRKNLQTMNADGLVEKCIRTMLLVGCKLVTANYENRMELHLKSKN